MNTQITTKPLSDHRVPCPILDNPVLGLSGLEPDSFSAYFVSNLTQAIEKLREDRFDQTTDKEKVIKALKTRISDIKCDLLRRREKDPNFSMLSSVQMDDIGGLQLLLWSGDNPNQTDSRSGNSPLHYAVAFNRKDHIQSLLLTPGIDVNLKNKKGRKPIDLCQNESVRRLLELHRKA